MVPTLNFRFLLCALNTWVLIASVLVVSGCAMGSEAPPINPNVRRDASVDRVVPPSGDVPVINRVCMPGESRDCYTGPDPTDNVGICRPGTQTCTAGGTWASPCVGERLPAAMEICGNAQDDDCNGMPDDGCGDCTAGMSRPCYTGPMGTSGRGVCHGGMQTCAMDRTWPMNCAGEVTPSAAEVCGNMMDDNCNGATDEMCGECMPGEVRPCYSGPAGTSGRGACRGGTQTCGVGGMWMMACPGEVLPAPMEVCGNAVDDDCNGLVDDACGECTAGMMRSCYTGPAGTAGTGICRNGTQTCNASRMWGGCSGEVRPMAAEVCGNMMDDNCNGMVDEMCGVCTPGMMRTCYTGPAGTAGVGICRNGSQTCDATRNWPAACAGEVRPAAAEVCGNMMDDNCNGMVDEGCMMAPANDNRASASLVTLRASEVTVNGSTVGATRDGPAAPAGCACQTGGNVWYRFTLAERTIFYADTAGSAYDTSLLLTDNAGTAIAGLCNDDAGCTVGGFTNVGQSMISGDLAAGTYYIAVGGCGTGAFTLHLQMIGDSFSRFIYGTPLTGTGNTPSTVLISGSRHVPGCTLGPSGEDLRYFVTCGTRAQLFSLCQSDGGSFSRRIGAVDYDPAISLWSANTGTEIACNDDGGSMGGVNCAGTGGDALNYGSRLNNITTPRGLAAVLIDERRNPNGMTYVLHYAVAR
jgi:hypothetical protein